MKRKKMIVMAGVAVSALLVLAAWAWNSMGHTGKRSKKPEIPFYFGIQKEIYSKSIVRDFESEYSFEPALQFDLIKHDFLIQNPAKEPLNLRNVTGCCGSIVERFSRQIPPGQEGVISIVLITDQRGGEEIKGIIRAETDSAAHPELKIHISCPVKKFADISVYKIMLDGSAQADIQGSSLVFPTVEYPFSITGIKPKKAVDITYKYEPVERDGRKGYLITAKNLRKRSGGIRNTLFIQTDNPQRPEFFIRVQGKITD